LNVDSRAQLKLKSRFGWQFEMLLATGGHDGARGTADGCTNRRA
jgi:hypothetical protein